MKHVRKRLTYANVMSSIAVFLVLGGATAFAAIKIGANNIKANAVTAGKIKKGAVTTAKLGNNAVTGAKAKESSFGQVPSAKVAASASNLLWAVVSNPAGAGNAVLVRSSQPAPTVAEATGVNVFFSRDVTGCAWLATRGLPGSGGAEVAGFAETGGVVGNPNGVDVRTRDDAGTIQDGNFHLAVICP